MTPFTPAKPGTKLAGFDIIAEVGRGAASLVYLAQDPRSKQVCALKHVRKNTPKDQRFLDQAESEYTVAQRVRHPLIRHIDRVIKGRAIISVKELFLVMEYVDGVSVEIHPPATLAAAVDIFRQTARGLAHMHDCGYVHADMKPNNIVVDEKGRVKIIDLGQACPIGTVKQRIQGTPDFIAPEQVHRREITPKTDIYNLGAAMYAVLTGTKAPTAMSSSGDNLVDSLEDEQIERPAPPSEVNSAVPPRLGELVLRCLEVKTADRPETMDDVADELDAIAGELGPAGDTPLGVTPPAQQQSTR